MISNEGQTLAIPIALRPQQSLKPEEGIDKRHKHDYELMI